MDLVASIKHILKTVSHYLNNSCSTEYMEMESSQWGSREVCSDPWVKLQKLQERSVKKWISYKSIKGGFKF